MKDWLIRAIVLVAVLEIVYLGVVNLALNMPWTQTLINQYKPEKFAVHWEHAWSWYPFRVQAHAISANGQSRSQQWELEAPAASGSISVLPLLQRSVNIRHVAAQDIVYHQRPRPKPDKDYAETRQFFPVIKDRPPQNTYVTPVAAEKFATSATAPKKKGQPWKINLTDARAQGRHRIWIYQVKGAFQGELQTDLTYQTRRGPLSLSNGEVDLKLDSLVIDGDREVASNGHLKGSVEMTPFCAI